MNKACWFSCLLLLGLAEHVGARQAGRLEVCTQHPYYFRDGNRHIVLVGVSDRALFSIWRNDKGFCWQRYLEDLALHHLNYVRQDVCGWGALAASVDYPAQFSNPAWPFVRPGPGIAIDGKPKFDLTKFEQSYFDRRLKPFLKEAGRHGIYVELTLFEGFNRTSFAESLYADRNNINQLRLHYKEVASDKALDNPHLMAIQHAYVDKVLAETAEFGNIIYEVANETGQARWVAHFTDYIHKHSKHPRQLVSAGEQSTSFNPCTGANDIIVKHRGGGGLYATDTDIDNHHRALLRFRVGKPVIHNEYFLFANRSTDDVDFVRKMMWGDFTAGGHSNFFDFTFWRGTGKTPNDGLASRSPPPEILRAGKHLLDFLTENNVNFWTMAPHDELAVVRGKKEAYVFTLAQPGHTYICYVLGDGQVRLNLRLVDGPFTAGWYDPKRGESVTPVQHIHGKESCLFHSPVFEQDIVLFVRRSPNL